MPVTLRKPRNAIRWRTPTIEISIQNLHIKQSPSHLFSNNLQMELREPTNRTRLRGRSPGLTARISHRVEAKHLSCGAEHA